MPGSRTDIDTKKMHSIYDRWPEHFQEASRIFVKSDHSADFYDSVVFCGMGGSGTACDVLNDLMRSYGSIPSSISRSRMVPRFVSKNSLVVINSVSGNTREAILMMEEAHAKGAEVICISSGGKMKEKSWEKGIKHVSIPNLFVPRASLPYLIMPGLRIIQPLLESKPSDASAMYRYLSRIRDEIAMTASEDMNRSRKVAEFLMSGFPFCFVSPYLAAVGTRFKNSLNENAKMHCLKDSVLEASHNEIVPFTFDNGIDARILLLEWDQDPALVKERFEKIRALCKKIGRPTLDLSISTPSMIDAIISSIYILDYASIYMAISRGVDPSPTPAIDILKESDS